MITGAPPAGGGSTRGRAPRGACQVTDESRGVRVVLGAVGLFAVAMAYVESAVVVYLRAIYGIEDLPSDLPPLPDAYTAIEIGREAATLIMLVVIGWVAGRRWQDRLGYAVFAFGAWDVFYYVWLHLFLGWPESLLDWDILFLIPVPWWGPVLAPLLIALLLSSGGAVAVIEAARGRRFRAKRLDWGVCLTGVVVALYIFMADALRALPEGVAAVGRVRPTSFPWPLFLAAIAAMAVPIVRAAGASPARS